LGKFFPARPFFYGDRPGRGKKKKTILAKIFPCGFLKVEADTTPRLGNQPCHAHLDRAPSQGSERCFEGENRRR